MEASFKSMIVWIVTLSKIGEAIMSVMHGINGQTNERMMVDVWSTDNGWMDGQMMIQTE